MKKKLVAVAIAAALVPAAAMAETSNVTVYGQANVSYDFVKTGGTNDVNNNKVSTNASRFGLKGSEDLGDGLSAVFQIEQAITMDAGGDTLAGRNTFAGLSSKSAGTVTLGNNDAPYKAATRRLDMFGDNLADNRSLTNTFDARNANLITYATPDMNGFSAAIAYANTSETRTTGATPKTDLVSMAGMYNAGPLYATLAYQKNDAGATDTKGLRLGAGYSMDAFAANFVYEKYEGTTAAADFNMYYLAGKYSFGNDAVKAAYTKRQSTDAGNDGAKQWSLGYDHSITKRTSLYALYTRMDNDSAAAFGLGTTGNQNTSAANGVGSDPSAFSFGMKHTF